MRLNISKENQYRCQCLGFSFSSDSGPGKYFVNTLPAELKQLSEFPCIMLAPAGPANCMKYSMLSLYLWARTRKRKPEVGWNAAETATYNGQRSADNGRQLTDIGQGEYIVWYIADLAIWLSLPGLRLRLRLKPETETAPEGRARRSQAFQAQGPNTHKRQGDRETVGRGKPQTPGMQWNMYNEKSNRASEKTICGCKQLAESTVNRTAVTERGPELEPPANVRSPEQTDALFSTRGPAANYT